MKGFVYLDAIGTSRIKEKVNVFNVKDIIARSIYDLNNGV
jgi:hypothetical protein